MSSTLGSPGSPGSPGSLGSLGSPGSLGSLGSLGSWSRASSKVLNVRTPPPSGRWSSSPRPCDDAAGSDEARDATRASGAIARETRTSTTRDARAKCRRADLDRAGSRASASWFVVAACERYHTARSITSMRSDRKKRSARTSTCAWTSTMDKTRQDETSSPPSFLSHPLPRPLAPHSLPLRPSLCLTPRPRFDPPPPPRASRTCA